MAGAMPDGGPGSCSAEQWDFDLKRQMFRCAKITQMQIQRTSAHP
jgi:hypothetical protein